MAPMALKRRKMGCVSFAAKKTNPGKTVIAHPLIVNWTWQLHSSNDSDGAITPVLSPGGGSIKNYMVILHLCASELIMNKLSYIYASSAFSRRFPLP